MFYHWCCLHVKNRKLKIPRISQFTQMRKLINRISTNHSEQNQVWHTEWNNTTTTTTKWNPTTINLVNDCQAENKSRHESSLSLSCVWTIHIYRKTEFKHEKKESKTKIVRFGSDKNWLSLVLQPEHWFFFSVLQKTKREIRTRQSGSIAFSIKMLFYKKKKKNTRLFVRCIPTDNLFKLEFVGIPYWCLCSHINFKNLSTPFSVFLACSCS